MPLGFTFRIGLAPRWVISSYGFNGWLGWVEEVKNTPGPRKTIKIEADLDSPSLTPTFLDYPGFTLNPRASDLPPTDLTNGGFVPRHGKCPRPVPTNYPIDQKLPGASNVAFYDGHVAQIDLDYLWQLHWHHNYVPPAKRPGLK